MIPEKTSIQAYLKDNLKKKVSSKRVIHNKEKEDIGEYIAITHEFGSSIQGVEGLNWVQT